MISCLNWASGNFQAHTESVNPVARQSGVHEAHGGRAEEKRYLVFNEEEKKEP